MHRAIFTSSSRRAFSSAAIRRAGQPGVTSAGDHPQNTKSGDRTLAQSDKKSGGSGDGNEVKEMHDAQGGPSRSGEQDSTKKGGLAGGTGQVAARNEKEAAEQEGSAQQYGKAGPAKSS
ncbi:hypothetical protein EXIGLDRAFT_833129, partial [Exidia glandulosa HHB12029]